jgi:hypothetical protein
MKLINMKTGRVVRLNSKVFHRGGHEGKIEGWTEPEYLNSVGSVIVDGKKYSPQLWGLTFKKPK